MFQDIRTYLRWVALGALLLVVSCAQTAVGTDGGGVDVVLMGNPDTDDVRGRDAPDDALPSPVLPVPDPRAPRLIAPLSCSYVTNRRPSLRWVLPPGVTGARVEICRDRNCTQVEEALTTTGVTARPTRELSVGVHFWRATAMEGSTIRREQSFTWEFRAPSQGVLNDVSTGSYFDLNGDGFGDVIVRNLDGRQVFLPGSRRGLLVHEGRLMPQGILRKIGDINGDGFLDLAEIRPGATSATVVFHFGSSEGVLPGELSMPALADGLAQPGMRQVGDIDHDGYGDFVYNSLRLTTNGEAALYTVFYLGGVGGPTSARSIRWDAEPRPGTQLLEAVAEAGDTNGDGLVDMAASLFTFSSSPWLLLYEGDLINPYPRPARRIEPPAGWSFATAAFPWDGTTFEISPCDINLDGRNDIIMPTVRHDPTTVAVNVYLGSDRPGNRFPDAEVALAVRRELGHYLRCVFDIDGDARSDVVVKDDNGIGWFPGSIAALGPRRPVLSGSEVDDLSGLLSGGDIDNDGHGDMIVLLGDVLRVFRGGPDGFVAAGDDVPANALRVMDSRDAGVVPTDGGGLRTTLRPVAF